MMAVVPPFSYPARVCIYLTFLHFFNIDVFLEWDRLNGIDLLCGVMYALVNLSIATLAEQFQVSEQLGRIFRMLPALLVHRILSSKLQSFEQLHCYRFYNQNPVRNYCSLNLNEL
eukprot:GEZU01011896.1.p1 GENE.GEZU01011896.1~~GEZU01011896.1.p1  ORF type:complete len:115 (+),score=7.08 GEZU01011896.1:72-416(+)